VIIPTYERKNTLARTLPTLFAQDFPADDYEVIVVVDGSTDGTLEFLRGLRPACSFRVLTQPNAGPASARNTGLRAAEGELILFLDDDILCRHDLLKEHVVAHQDDGRARVVFGPVLVASESRVGLATDWTREHTHEYLARLSQSGQPSWPRDAMVDANSSIPRSAVLAAGGFDESFFLSRETAELGLRLSRMGVRFQYCPSAMTWQIFSKNTRDLVKKDALHYGRNEVRLCRLYPEYRRFSPLAALGRESRTKGLARQALVRASFVTESVLGATCWLVERGSALSLMRRIGLRLLKMRQGTTSYRGAMREVGSWEDLRAEYGRRLPVLLYHRVGPPERGTFPELTIPPSQFEQHVRWLARHGYVGIAASDWMAWCSHRKPLPRKAVLLTFDDAYADLAEYALPVLKKYGFSGTVFVVTGQVGGSNVWDEPNGSASLRCMSAEQIQQWAKCGIEFGAHGHTHADLSKLSSDCLEGEVDASAQYLARILGTRVRSFAYPYGYFSEAAKKRVNEVFDLAFTCDEGLNSLGTDPALLSRTMVRPEETLFDLASCVMLGYSPMTRLRQRRHGIRSRNGVPESVEATKASVQ